MIGSRIRQIKQTLFGRYSGNPSDAQEYEGVTYINIKEFFTRGIVKLNVYPKGVISITNVSRVAAGGNMGVSVDMNPDYTITPPEGYAMRVSIEPEYYRSSYKVVKITTVEPW